MDRELAYWFGGGVRLARLSALGKKLAWWTLWRERDE
jgi:hypothetical protein